MSHDRVKSERTWWGGAFIVVSASSRSQSSSLFPLHLAFLSLELTVRCVGLGGWAIRVEERAARCRLARLAVLKPPSRDDWE